MELDLDIITGWVEDFFWPFLRIGALFIASPIFGARTVPVRIRILLAVAVTVLLQPTLPYLTPIDVISADGFLVIFQQLLVGLLMGIALQIMFASLVMAGQIIATTMGLGFASSVDPQNGIQVTMIGQLYLILATLYFLSMDGHLLMIQMLADSFVAIPISMDLIPVQLLFNIALFAAQMFLSAVLIALPIMVGVLLVNLGFGVMTRAAPQLNIFAVGFPTTMLAGFVLIYLCLPVLSPVLQNLFNISFEFIRISFN